MSMVLFLLFIVLFNPLPCLVDASGTTLRSADVQQEDYPTVQAVKYMGELLAERSGGRLSIDILHSRQAGEEKEAVEQCRAGGLDMVRRIQEVH